MMISHSDPAQVFLNLLPWIALGIALGITLAVICLGAIVVSDEAYKEREYDAKNRNG